MDEREEQRQAAEALATIQEHQERTRRAARLPWWVYAAMFVVSAAGSAVNDFISVSGSKVIAVLVLVVLAVTFLSGSAPLSKLRGVQPQQSFDPRVFGVVLFVGGLGAWLISHYGNTITHDVADAVGLGHYPNTVAGVILGAAFTALFALGQLLLAASRRRSTP